MLRTMKGKLKIFALAGMVAGILTPGLSSAQDSANQGLPTPDFSTMQEWYEIRRWEYDIHTRQIRLIIVAKTKSRPPYFDLRFEDADGIIVSNGENLICGGVTHFLVVGQPERCWVATPAESVLRTVKKVHAVRRVM